MTSKEIFWILEKIITLTLYEAQNSSRSDHIGRSVMSDSAMMTFSPSTPVVARAVDIVPR